MSSSRVCGLGGIERKNVFSLIDEDCMSRGAFRLMWSPFERLVARVHRTTVEENIELVHIHCCAPAVRKVYVERHAEDNTPGYVGLLLMSMHGTRDVAQ